MRNVSNWSVIVFAVIAALRFSIPAFGAVDPSARVTKLLRQDLNEHKQVGFAKLLASWESKYGVNAVKPLVHLAKDKKLDDTDRFVAIMGAVKLGGAAVGPHLEPLFKDKSWLIRSGTLRILTAIKSELANKHAFALLKDKALLVRSEAVTTLSELQPKGTAHALIESLQSAQNYHGGIGQIVPYKAVTALKLLKDKESCRKEAKLLLPLLRHYSDPKLVLATGETLSALTGKNIPANIDAKAYALAWEKTLK